MITPPATICFCRDCFHNVQMLEKNCPTCGSSRLIKHPELDKLFIDRDRHLVTWGGEHIELTVTECLLLISLCERPGAVKKRDQLMDAAYGVGHAVSDRTIDSHVRNIRQKFKDVDPKVELISTVHGLGYKLKL